MDLLKMKNNFSRSGELIDTLVSFRREFFWVCAFSMIANVLMLSPTLYMLQIYDRVMISGNQLTLIFLTIIIVFFFCLMAFSEWLRSKLLVRIGLRLDRKLNARIFNVMFQDHLRSVKQNPTEAYSNLTFLRQFLTGNGIIAILDSPWTPIYIAVIFLLSPTLGCVSIFFSIIQIAMAFYSHKISTVPAEESFKASSANKFFLSSKLKNAEAVEAMGMGANIRNRWLSIYQNHQLKLDRLNDMQHRQQSITKGVRYCMQSLTLAAGAMLVLKGDLTAGSMVAVNVLMSRALQPLDQIVGTVKDLVQAKKAYLALEKILADYPERNSLADPITPQGSITFNDLVAKAPAGGKEILKHISLNFPAGKVTAITGPSGSGKSTLARCLVGIWQDFSGDISLDGRPLKDWDRNALGPFVGYLPQDIELFSGTVAENISRFYENDSEKIIKAAQLAGVHEMILKLPLGYDTPIGDAGLLLSAGQKQRVALARAVYGEPVIVVLDEPNSNLDEQGERALMQAIQTLKLKGKSIFIITHRPNLLNVVDNWLILENGQVSQYDTRDNVVLNLKNAIK
jgi:ATP-binding cassette subfamily C exporter for protease/lipase